MTDRPIIFSAPMIRALLDGRKTQTRRVVAQPDTDGGQRWVHYPPCWFLAVDDGDHWIRQLPYTPGDRLWVREAWMYARYRADNSEPVPELGALYRADGCYGGLRGWRSPIHMPRAASRLTLTVTDVRVQRLHDITEADAVAEGIVWSEPTEADRQWAASCAEETGGNSEITGVWIAPGTRQGYGSTALQRDQPQWGPTAPFAYRCLWNSIHGPEAWDANPWVAALTFTVRQGNIDA